jgi:hypothetical protein
VSALVKSYYAVEGVAWYLKNHTSSSRLEENHGFYDAVFAAVNMNVLQASYGMMNLTFGVMHLTGSFKPVAPTPVQNVHWCKPEFMSCHHVCLCLAGSSHHCIQLRVLFSLCSLV